MIDRIYMTTLERTPERHEACFDKLVNQGVPPGMIYKHMGIDNLHFATTREMVEWTIQEKGWTFFETFLEQGFHNEILIAGLGQSLSYFEAFEHSMDTEKTLLVISDDRELSCQFPKLVEALLHELEDFYMVSISADYMWVPNAEGGHLEYIINTLKTHEMQPDPGCQFIRGMQTPTDQFVISPEGAAYFFELFSNQLISEPVIAFQVFTELMIPEFNTSSLRDRIFSADRHFCQILGMNAESLLHQDTSDVEDLEDHYKKHEWPVHGQHPDIVYKRPPSQTRDNAN